MKTLKQIREQLGLNQPDFARYLGISKSTLAHAENGMRTLNVNSLIRLALLEKTILEVASDKSTIDISPDETKEYIRGYQLREQNCRFQAGLLKRKLDELDKMYENAMCLGNVLKKLTKNQVVEPGWITEMRKKNLTKLPLCTIAIREKMRHKINLLMHEAEHICQYLENKPIL